MMLAGQEMDKKFSTELLRILEKQKMNRTHRLTHGERVGPFP